MKAFDLLTPSCLFIEIGQSAIKVVDATDSVELTIERLPSGRLTETSREKLIADLRGFLKQQNWMPRRPAFCAVGARGVSLRHLTLPAAPKEELQRLLTLQIESQFPLSPDELAWGYRTISQDRVPRNGGGNKDLILAAVKREVIDEYWEIFSACGLSPVFTLGALARSSVCPEPPNSSFAVLDIGRSNSELIVFDKGVPGSIRILPWGGEDITRAIQQKLGISRDEAEQLKTQQRNVDGARGELFRTAIREEINALVPAIKNNWAGKKLYLAGKSSRLNGITTLLAESIGGGVGCVQLSASADNHCSEAIQGLKSASEKNGASPLLILEARKGKGRDAVNQPAVWQWLALSVLLLLGSLFLRYAEPLFQKPRLSKKLAEVKSYRGNLPIVDRELSFLQFFETNQPPYLNVISTLANAAAPGLRIESLSLNRGGTLSLRGSMQNAQQATDFRTKLIDSELFSAVVLDELTPTPDRQKVIVRLTAQWKIAAKGKPIPDSAAPNAQDKSKAPGKNAKPESLAQTNTAPTSAANRTNPPQPTALSPATY